MSTIKIPVSKRFIEIRDMHAAKYGKTDKPSLAMLKRADCELYEWHMEHINEWGGSDVWSIDGISDKYGKVDVKMIYGYWNIDGGVKIRNIFRQLGVLDHWYFIEKIDWPTRPLEEGDVVEVGFVGVMTPEEVCKKIEVSFKASDMYYVDVRKHCKQ